MIGGTKDFTPVACIFMSGLNDIFYWQADVLILTKSLLMSILLVSMSIYLASIFDNSDVSSANILHIDFKLSGKSFI